MQNFLKSIHTWKHNSSVNEISSEQLSSLSEIVNIVDFGAGDGFWGKLSRYIFKESIITGVELEPSYIHKFNLEAVYDTIINDNILTVSETISGDLLICCDVLEHLEKNDCVKVLNNIKTKFKYILINSPIGFQPQEHEFLSEHHRCGLCREDFVNIGFNILSWNEFDNHTMFNCFLRGDMNV
jgi:hypothetical protein